MTNRSADPSTDLEPADHLPVLVLVVVIAVVARVSPFALRDS